MVNVSGLVLGSPEQNANLSPVHEDEAFALVRDVGSKASSNNAMPSWKVHGIEFNFDYLCNVVKDSSLLESECNTVYSMLLHVLVHICILNYSIFGLLLVDCSMRLYNLFISISLPFLGFICTSIRSCTCHFKSLQS